MTETTGRFPGRRRATRRSRLRDLLESVRAFIADLPAVVRDDTLPDGYDVEEASAEWSTLYRRRRR